jgi:ketosteroid isomerase-like protein
VALVFFPVYAGCAALTALRDSPWRLYVGWELEVPFLPFMVVPYLSMFVLFLMPPLQLVEDELDALADRLIAASLLGAVVFLALPARMGFLPRTDAGAWQGIYDAIYRVDGPFNMVPSFHVIYTASILLAMARPATPALRRAYLIWLAVVCASTVLTHRHHLLDVAAGLGLALAVRALPRRARLFWPAPAGKETSAMRSITLSAIVCALAASVPASAQDASQAADHDALRKIKSDVIAAINTRDLRGMDRILYKPFMVTVITQDSFTDTAALQAYYDGLFSRKLLRIARITMGAEADELSQIYTGTFAVARGSTTERYEMADGRRFDMRGRWTATAIKDGGQWKLLAIHDGTNFLDNPVLTAVEKGTLPFGIGGLVVGLALGLVAGFLAGRRRAPGRAPA